MEASETPVQAATPGASDPQLSEQVDKLREQVRYHQYRYYLLDDPEIKEYQLVANDAVRGPDFPTGGQVLNTRDELREISQRFSDGLNNARSLAPSPS